MNSQCEKENDWKHYTVGQQDLGDRIHMAVRVLMTALNICMQALLSSIPILVCEYEHD